MIRARRRSAFGRMLFEARKNYGIKQADLAAQVGVGPAVLSRFEANVDSPHIRQPSRQMVLRLAEALGMSGAGRDAMLMAAGHAPLDPLSVLESEPEVLAAARLVLDADADPAVKAEIRSALQGVLEREGSACR